MVVDFLKFSYIFKVFKEILRLCLLVFVILRWVEFNDIIGDYFIECGSLILFSFYFLYCYFDFWEFLEIFNLNCFDKEF